MQRQTFFRSLSFKYLDTILDLWVQSLFFQIPECFAG